jgi:hypothetical protein
MALEVTTTIEGLVSANPVTGDTVAQGDDHIRLLKTVLKATPLVVDRAYGEYTANANIASTLPFDDTTPQNTEGAQIISVSITPKSTANRIRLRFQGVVISGVGSVNIAAAVFSSASADALRTTFSSTGGADFATTLYLEHEYVPASTSAHTFTVRVGSQTGAAFRMNGAASARFFGGTMAATLVLEEIQAS